MSKLFLKVGSIFFTLHLSVALLSFPVSYSYGETGDNVQIPLRAPKIVGGHESTPGAWPWMTALVYSDSQDLYNGQFCGGSLIHPGWVVTAAHCVNGMTPDQLDVVVNIHDLSQGTGERIDVSDIIVHPSYNPSTDDSDIALLQLATNASVTPVPVYFGSDLLTGATAITMGWGALDNAGSSFPTALQEVSIPVVSNSVCNAGYNSTGNYSNPITDNMMCAGYSLGGKDSCQGDSGGPLIADTGSGKELIGIVSWGEGCAQPNLYGVYTRISEFSSFIQSYIDFTLITGTVTTTFAGHNDLGVANAIISIPGTAFTAGTDMSGRYQLNVDPGTYTLNFTAPGFADQSGQVTVSSGIADGSVNMVPLAGGDLDGDGKIGLSDAVGILQTVGGLR